MADLPESVVEIPLTPDEHRAIRAVYAGEASEHQQRLALDTIIHKISRAHDMPYIPGSFDASAFFMGRQMVGKKIIKYIKAKVEDSKNGDMA